MRLTVIEELTDGKINASTAAVKLNLSVRQVKRLKKKLVYVSINGSVNDKFCFLNYPIIS